MAKTFILRFFGRFVFHERRSQPGFIDALAIDMTFNPDVASARHRPVMSVARALISRPGSVPADLTVMASTCSLADEVPERLEHGVWHLEGRAVSIEVGDTLHGTFKWQDNATLLDIGQQAGRTKPHTAVEQRGSTPGPVIAGIRIPAGSGVARSLFDDRVQMVQLGNSTPSDKELETLPILKPADVVEVTLELDHDLLLTLRKQDGTGPSSSVIIIAQGQAPTVVHFTNLCSNPSEAAVDEEFAGLYEILAEPPRTRDRLVPRRSGSLAGIDNCYPSVLLRSE